MDSGELKPNVELRPFDETQHLDQFCVWLRRPHVSRWWGDPAFVLKQLADARTSRALIFADSQPIGFLCWQHPAAEEMEQAGLSDLPADLIDIDIFIGEPELCGCSLGPRALTLLLERLRAERCTLAGLATAIDNTRAQRAFEKVGFKPYREFEEEGKRMIYLIRTISDV